jgi:predicted enzyme related to lactoylglutathione lyase
VKVGRNTGRILSGIGSSVGLEAAGRRRRRENAVRFISTRIITADVKQLVAFYEQVTGVAAVWGNDLFAEIPTPIGTVAIGSDRTVPLFGAGSAEPAANRSAILEFIVDDVDAEYVRLRDLLTDVVTEPTTMPWGNRALLFRDPDGNLINLFTPVSDQARTKFGL